MVPINPPKTGFEEPPKGEKGKGTPLLDALQREQQFLKDALTMGTAKAKLEERIRDLMKEQNGLSEEQARKQVLLADADQKRLALQEQIKDVLAQGMTDAVMGLIEGTKTLGEAAKNILNDLANTLVKLGVNTILGSFAPGIFGGLPMLKFARGGRPPTGKASLVGEKGPELFVPRRTGTVVPNDKLGGGSTNINVNIDASGSSVQGDAQQSKELGRAISAAIQSELLKQKRPGGLLT